MSPSDASDMRCAISPHCRLCGSEGLFLHIEHMLSCKQNAILPAGEITPLPYKRETTLPPRPSQNVRIIASQVTCLTDEKGTISS